MDFFKELKDNIKKLGKKVLFFDLETSLMTVYTHYIGQKVSINHNQIIKETKIICAQYKWEGEKTARAFVSECTKKGIMDRNTCYKISQLLNTADIVIAQNGKAFDIRKLQWRLAQLNLPPVNDIKMIDTLREAQKSFASPSHKLDYRSKQYNLGGKTKMEFDDWIKIDKGDEKALDKMVKYGLKDVEDLQKIFWRELPYYHNIQQHMGRLIEKSRETCPKCASKKNQKRGFNYSIQGKKQRYQCTNCGNCWSDTKLVK